MSRDPAAGGATKATAHRATVVALLLIGPAAAATAMHAPAAHAATGCPGPMPVGRPVVEVPWPQRDYGLDRLIGIADGHGVTVAVVDSGVDANHPQLRGRVVAGFDTLGGQDGRVDCAGHGTAVASIVAGAGEPGAGFQGVARQALILPIRVSERETVPGGPTTGAPTGSVGRAGTAAGLAQGIRAAVDRRAAVLNVSVVLYRDDPQVRSAVAYALAHDVVLVAAVGNAHDQGDPAPYPAAYDGVLGVGAVGPDRRRWPGSQVGPYVDLLAPGSQVVAAAPGGGYAGYDGTSFAAPYVAGAAALIRQYRPELSARDVVTRLLDTADPAPDDAAGQGRGVANPVRAVTGVLGGEAAPALYRGATRGATRGGTAGSPGGTARRGRRAALRTASVAIGLVGAALLASSVVARGRRRRWRPAS